MGHKSSDLKCLQTNDDEMTNKMKKWGRDRGGGGGGKTQVNNNMLFFTK